MAKQISFVYKGIIVYKILTTCVIRRIDIDEVNLSFMRFEEQLQGGKVVAFKKEVHLTAAVDEQAAVLGQHRGVRSRSIGASKRYSVSLLPCQWKEYSGVLLGTFPRNFDSDPVPRKLTCMGFLVLS